MAEKELVFEITLKWKAPQNDERRHFSTRIARPDGGTTLIYPGVSYKLKVTESIMKDLLRRQSEYEIEPFQYEKRVPRYEEMPTKVVVIEYAADKGFSQYDKEAEVAASLSEPHYEIPEAGTNPEVVNVEKILKRPGVKTKGKK